MVYLDADIQVFDNIDHLFDLDKGSFYAVMDCFCEKTWSHTPQYKIGYCQQCPDRVAWPERELGVPPPPLYFNAGMFMHEPSLATAKALLDRLVVTDPTPFAEQDRSVWERMFRLNVFGTMGFMKHELRQMEQQGSGAIVNTSSMSGKNGSPGLSPYNATKWAVNGMTQTAALEYAAHGIRVNAICPGATLTTALAEWKDSSPQQYEAVTAAIPMKRMADPSEQADAAVWLCSDEAAFVTGTLLNVDGGDGVLGKQ